MGVDHVIPELCVRALDREDPFRVFGPEQRRAFCHIADALEAITSLMATERARGQIVNIGNDTDETRVSDLLALILRICEVHAHARSRAGAVRLSRAAVSPTSRGCAR
jgi:UDP-glucose 4-epimerase/UDP-glucuronate decarboxylase